MVQSPKEHIEKLINKNDLIALSDVCEILRPRRLEGTGKNLTTYEYPINYNTLKDNFRTTVSLHKNDIILRGCMMTNIYFVDEEPVEVIYAKPTDMIFRPKENIQPEYLYLFLKSETGQMILSFFSSPCANPRQVSLRTAKECIFIVPPSLQRQEYRNIFEIESNFNVDMSTYNKLIKNWKQTQATKNISSFLNVELLNKVFLNKQNTFIELIKADVAELNLCFNAQAYKATLILAGSILEAILIDWLSEKHKKDYFTEDFIVQKDGKAKRAELVDYINEIKLLEKPRWYKEAKMAHDIRKKRNLVHAKLGINSNEINEDTCKMVVEYLEQVIETRINYSKNTDISSFM